MAASSSQTSLAAYDISEKSGEIEDILLVIEEDIEKEVHTLDQCVLQKMKQPLNQPKTTLSSVVIDDAISSIKTDVALTKLVTPALHNYSGNELLPHLQFLNDCLVQRGFFILYSKEETWTKFHVAMQDNMARLTNLFETSKLASWVCLRIFERLMDINYSKSSKKQLTVSKELREDEVDVVQYVCGFVLQRVKKNLLRQSSSNSKCANLDCITKLIETAGPSAGQKTLIECKNRGGLLCPNQRLLEVFVELEKLFRAKYQDTHTVNLSREEYLESALSNEHIICSFYETVYSSWASNEVKEVLLKEMIIIYFHTRAHSKCRQVMERMRVNTLTTKRQKGLRKSLEKACKNNNQTSTNI